MSIKARHKFSQHLVNRERSRFGNKGCVVDKDDIDFIVTELWRSKCAATLERAERVGMEITRWRRDRGDAAGKWCVVVAVLVVVIVVVAVVVSVVVGSSLCGDALTHCARPDRVVRSVVL